MTKLLYHSNAPWTATGYGNQTGLFAPRLAEHYELGLSAFYGLEGNMRIWNKIPVFPGLGGEFGNAYLKEHYQNFDADLLMTLMDVWVLDPKLIATMNACCWVPVDHDPCPPMVSSFFAQSGAVPIAMSRFGQANLEPFDPLFVPHGCDTNVYRPRDRQESREELGFPEDAFLVGMVAANKGAPSRKGFQQAFEAFREIRKRNSKAIFYLHSTMQAEWTQGEDLGPMLASLEIPEEAVRLANQYRMHFFPHDAETMSKFYSSFDCLLNPSMGEGFGIPMLEAQACGTPVIATDFSAMKEVVAAGWKVRCRPFWTKQRSWQAVADVGDLVKAMEACNELTKPKKDALSTQARQHAMKYDADRVMKKFFLPALEQVEERLLKPKAPSVPAKVIA